ncbi:hypothetical protein [Pedobacter glucosidilyticus]|uniref:hypothetical protein n=1 Tax=Pedobacter glucosidilyticus TaxID=1122941 RepID=UPI0026F2A4BB|nr:hypothetical protein [Pedobacter glucosidilyticus]
MKIKEDFIKAILSKEIRNYAREMFNSDFEYNGNKDKMPVDMFDISFRLFKPNATNVNLEFLAVSPQGKYFQPIGFYDKEDNVFILNEFLDSYNELFSLGQIQENVKKLDLKTNAVIASFSMTTASLAFQTLQDFKNNGWNDEIRGSVNIPGYMRYDKKFKNNGFNCNLLFSNNGYPQFYLDDEYGLEDAIGAYIENENGRFMIHPTTPYKNSFDILNHMSLLTAFKKI